jgi:8-amino-7-oxononanoate synthase
MTHDQDRLRHHVAVVGIGCRFPMADDADTFWAHIRDGRPCFSEVPRSRWDHSMFFSKNGRDVDKTWTPRGGFIEDVESFAPLHYGIAPRRLEVMDPQHRLLIEATRVAIQDAGYERRDFDRSRTGVFTGLSVSEYKNLILGRIAAMQLASGQYGKAATPELAERILELTPNLVPTRAFSIAGSLSNMAAASVAQTFDLGGPAFSVDAACASASVAVYDAVWALRTGQIDVALAGGAYVNLTPDNLIGFTRVGAISASGWCRPFDARADGFVQGDGIGVVFLKRLQDALQDGDRVYAVIRGAGCNNDGRGEGPMTPRVEGQLAVLRAAYRDAELSPAEVRFFEAHGTGTSVGDPVEIESLGRLLTEAEVDASRAPWLGSVKANVGHTMSAAGIAGLIKGIKIVQEGVAPPQPDFQGPHPKLGLERWPLRISDALRPLEGPAYVGVSSFGFGGTNAHFVLEPPTESRPTARTARVPAALESAPEAVVVTAPTPALLAGQLRALADAVPGLALADVADSLAGRRFERYRAVIVARSTGELAETLRGVAERVAEAERFPLKAGADAEVFDAGETPSAPRLAFLFPGQGAQRLGLLSGFRERVPAFGRHLARLEAACADLLPRPLSSYVYPERADEAALAALTATEVCQPAMAALALALSATLREAGVEAEVSLGHSLGEFSALADGGVLDDAAAVRLVARRGRAMAELALDDCGAMAAVAADRPAVEAVIGAIDGVVVANENRPGQVSISGTTPAVEAACEALEAAGLRTTRLSVSHAFHSPLLEPVRAQMAPIVAELALAPARHTVASCIADAPYGADEAATRDTLVRHATAPVRFVGALEQARAAGADTWVQLGGGTVLASFARATFGRDAPVLALGARDEDDGRDVVRSLATLAALGAPIDLVRIYGRQARGPVTLPETPLERLRFWAVRAESQPLPRIDGWSPEDPAPLGLESVPSAIAPAPEPTAVPATGPSAELVALFAQQARVLEAHARILADQNRALLGGAVEPAALDVQDSLQAVSTPRPAATTGRATLPSGPIVAGGDPTERPTQAPPPDARPTLAPEAAKAAAAAAMAEPDEDAIASRVFEVVAKVSAFPPNSLRGEQRLVDELGFDSLMVADLGAGLSSVFPSLGALPRSLFSMSTTVSDIARHVVKAVSGPRDVRPTDAPEAPLGLYRARPVAVAAPDLPGHEPRGERWLITEDAGPLGLALAAALERRGAQVARVRVVDGDEAAPDRVVFGAMTVWPRTRLARLPSALESDGGVQGWIEAAAAGADDPLSIVHPIARGLRPARVGLLSGLGGALGLDAPSPRAATGGLILGYAKAAAAERSDAVVRGLDVAIDAPVEATAEAVVTELLGADRAAELGLGAARTAARLAPVALPSGEARPGVVLITGGAGALGAELAEMLVERGARGVVLIGRRPIDETIAGLVARLSRGGAPVEYHAADVTDRAALAAVLEKTRHLGPIDCAVHSAGLIDDAKIEALELERVARVVRVKLEGYRALRATLGPSARIVVFSSWAGRFGNAHQAPYSAANEAVDRLAIADGDRGLSIAWPPWSGTGMVDAIPAAVQAMMRAEGVSFVGLREGARLAAELVTSPLGGLVVVGRGLPPTRPRLAFEGVLDLERHPYLVDHQIDGRPVLPLAAATDLLGQAARAGLEAASGPIELSDLELLEPVAVETSVPYRVELDSNAAGRVQLVLVADGRPAYRAEARRLEHATVPELVDAATPEPLPFDVACFYREHTFHGPHFQGIESIERLSAEGIVGTVSPSRLADWLPGSPRTQWASDPRLLDASFQLAGYWAFVHHRRAGWPIAFGRLVCLRPLDGLSLRARFVLDEAEGDRFVGSVRYETLDGEPVAWLERLEGRLQDVTAPRPEIKGANGHEAGKDNGHTVSELPPPPVPAESWDIARFEEVELLDQRLQMASLIGLENPYFTVHDGTARNRSTIGGVEMINFSSYNYLGFSGHPEVVAAAQEAIARYGTSVSASRVASGERPIHRELERGLADHVGVEDSLVFTSGHATNVTTVGHLLGKDDIVLHDALIHDSVLQGIYLSGAARRPYPHEDLDALERTLARVRGSYRRAMICAEGIYSMDGDICRLPRLIELKKKYGCLLLIDEAHSTGVLGPAGRGVAHHYAGVDPKDVDVWMGTLSKSFASCGGFIAGSAALIRYLKYTAPGFVYSAGITPPNAAAALKSLELMHRHPEVVETLRQRSRRFLELCRARGLNTGHAVGAAVVPVIVGNSMDCVRLSAALKERRINVQPIVYPAVEDDAARLRFFLSSTHEDEELVHTADTVAEELARIRGGEEARSPARP